MTMGFDWILCSFRSSDDMEEVLSGGPCYVAGHIVGIDKWLPSFSPLFLKGLTAPIWIHLPLLPLQC